MRVLSIVTCLWAIGVQGAVIAPIARRQLANSNVTEVGSQSIQAADGFWMNELSGKGIAAFNPNPSGYKVFRNVKEFGAKGDGVTDDTAAINIAISSGGRCGPQVCDSATDSPAVVYFPAGTYIISEPIIFYYMTQLIGDARDRPVLKAASSLRALALIDASPYGNNGQPGWTSTNVFLRQIRNLVIDGTAVPVTEGFQGIHWPASQATTIQNVKIIMTQSNSSPHCGIFVENGSGGHMADLEIEGGRYGLNIGNQQFTIRNVKISKAQIGISQIWDWGFLYSEMYISDCGVAFSMISGWEQNKLQIGSVVFIDSEIKNCPVFTDSTWKRDTTPTGAGQLILENIKLNNVPTAVTGYGVIQLPGTTGIDTIKSWGQGNKYSPDGPEKFQGSMTFAPRPQGLLNGDKYWAKSKPTYANLNKDDFISVRDRGATGNGRDDDTNAIQAAIKSAAESNKILYFEHGVYKITNTIYVQPGTRMTGETFPALMAAGSVWSNKDDPKPVIQIGKPGDRGSVEWSDMLVQTQGETPGAILIQYNLDTERGSGIWDVHTRIGGSKGTGLQVADCPVGSVNKKCMAAHTNVHITKTGQGAYFENNWFWTADHDLDDPKSTQISVFTGRGLHVEASNVFLWASGVEHHALYQYQFNNALNIFAGFIQTETPYYMPSPDARNQPYGRSDAYNDPDYAAACPANQICDAYGLRILNSKNVMILGGGLYSFFQENDNMCSSDQAADGRRDCQNRIFSVEGDSSVQYFAMNQVGALEMITVDGVDKASWRDNLGVYSNTIGWFTYGF